MPNIRNIVGGSRRDQILGIVILNVLTILKFILTESVEAVPSGPVWITWYKMVRVPHFNNNIVVMFAKLLMSGHGWEQVNWVEKCVKADLLFTWVDNIVIALLLQPSDQDIWLSHCSHLDTIISPCRPSVQHSNIIVTVYFRTFELSQLLPSHFRSMIISQVFNYSISEVGLKGSVPLQTKSLQLL